VESLLLQYLQYLFLRFKAATGRKPVWELGGDELVGKLDPTAAGVMPCERGLGEIGRGALMARREGALTRGLKKLTSDVFDVLHGRKAVAAAYASGLINQTSITHFVRIIESVRNTIIAASLASSAPRSVKGVIS
jgi:hypothetical protein